MIHETKRRMKEECRLNHICNVKGNKRTPGNLSQKQLMPGIESEFVTHACATGRASLETARGNVTFSSNVSEWRQAKVQLTLSLEKRGQLDKDGGTGRDAPRRVERRRLAGGGVWTS